MILELTPSPLLQAFHATTVVVDCGNPSDLEGAACAAFFMWQVDYPEYGAQLQIPENPAAEQALNQALFAPVSPPARKRVRAKTSTEKNDELVRASFRRNRKHGTKVMNVVQKRSDFEKTQQTRALLESARRVLS